MVSLAAIGTVDSAPAADWGAALEARGYWAQLSGYLHGLAGVSLAAFVWSIHGLATRQSGRARLAAWGLFAGLAWAASFMAGGIVIFAAAELANYQSHADGAKTVLILGHILYANPISALLVAAFAFSVGRAALVSAA